MTVIPFLFLKNIYILGYSCILLVLIFTGADVNAKDKSLLTPLHRAAASQNEVCFQHKRVFGLKERPTDYNA